MATFSVNVPDSRVDHLVRAIADQKAIAPPTTALAKAALAEDFCQEILVQVVASYLVREMVKNEPGW